QRLRRGKHGEGLADTRRGAEEDLEPPTLFARGRRLHLGKQPVRVGAFALHQHAVRVATTGSLPRARAVRPRSRDVQPSLAAAARGCGIRVSEDGGDRGDSYEAFAREAQDLIPSLLVFLSIRPERPALNARSARAPGESDAA